MKAYTNKNLALSVIDWILDPYAANPYVIIGYSNGGVWQDREFLSTQSAINKALERISSCQRLQNLVLIAPSPCILELKQSLHFLDSQGVKIDIYIGEKECESRAILESLCACSVVRFYKNISFTHCVS